MADFGRGMYLVPANDGGRFDNDLDIDRSGDLRTTETEFEELQKDVALLTSVVLQGEVGRPLRPEALNRIDGLLRGAIAGEDRIQRLLSLDVQESVHDPNTVSIRALVITDNTEQELVFSEGVN